MPTDQGRAYAAVLRAIAEGRLGAIREQACVSCGAPAHHWHHWRGYAPAHALDVRPYCRTCHRQEHWLDELHRVTLNGDADRIKHDRGGLRGLSRRYGVSVPFVRYLRWGELNEFGREALAREAARQRQEARDDG